jgi:TIR domain
VYAVTTRARLALRLTISQRLKSLCVFSNLKIGTAMATTLLSPRLFISYSRANRGFADKLAIELRQRGFRVFLDTSDIDPGDNFVSRLAKEINRSTGIVAVISEKYSLSRWGQAELYSAIAGEKVVIPTLISPATMSGLDEPLQRLLRDTQYVTITGDPPGPDEVQRLGELLAIARRRHRKELFRRLGPVFLGGAVVLLAVWWAVAHLNSLKRAETRNSVISEVVNANAVLQHPRIASLASAVTGDQEAIGRLMFLSQDPAASDTARFNALALGSELRKGQKSWRWYVRGLEIDHAKLEDVAFVNTSFLGGGWNDVQLANSTFAGVFLGKDRGFSMSNVVFHNVDFFGGEMQAINAIDVRFVNAKFRGMDIDTTNFSKVRFITEEPKVEGNPVITPEYTLIENSVLKSERTPPQTGVIDLTMTGDDIVFDNVVFVHSRLEGWFRPEWFRNSTFEDCKLPESLTKDSLTTAGNSVTQ